MKKIHFLGIGGIGMSGLARWAIYNGFLVSGYDRDNSEMTNELKREGVNIFFDKNYIYQILPDYFADIIVYSSAFKPNHPIFNYFKKNDFRLIKRSAFLAEIASSYHVIAIAGTHGKTTISCMLTHILKNSGIDCNAFLGGISKNYKSNILIGKSKIMIIEADEYDRSFLSLEPDIGLVSSMDKDHGDTYNTYDDMLIAYNIFIQKCKKIIIHSDLQKKVKNSNRNNIIFYSEDSVINNKSYSIRIDPNPNNDIVNLNVMEGNQSLISLNVKSMPQHNIQNLLAAITIAIELNVKYDKIVESIKSFKGVSRRFEYHVNNDNLILIEDYAHHPVELNSLIDSTASLYPKKKITLIFQPHLFSRTKEFLDDFSLALSRVDRLILLDIYPARENPIKNFGVKDLFVRIHLNNKIILNKKDICKYLLNIDFELIIVAGAGDVFEIIPDLKRQFS